MDTTKESLTVLSLCSGLLLGLDRGFEAALGRKPRTVAYVEIEAFIVANLIAGMEAGVLVWQTAELAFRTLLKKHEQKNL